MYIGRLRWCALFVVFLVSCPHRPPPPVTPPPTTTPPPATPLIGFVELHAHPMANLGFAGKLMYGGPDWADGGGALLPSDPDCNENVRATSLEQALGHDKSTHGEWELHNTCGDSIRMLVISAVQGLNRANDPPQDATGAPAFDQWPRSNDVTHQVMWIESIRRAHAAGLRVMVALAVNNRTLADVVAGIGDGPDDDMTSADLQIDELKGLVGRHSDFMEVAYSPDDLQRIVAAGKLAVVLGLEIDNIGNFNQYPSVTPADVRLEIARLRSLGVRYLFPIHLIDNPFGSTAAYEDLFDLSNLREAGHFWNLQCADPADQIAYRLQMKNPLRDPFSDPLTAEMAVLMLVKLHLFSLDDPAPPPCALDGGVVNRGAAYPGLTPTGEMALREMMGQCMLLDVDHMSMASRAGTLALMADAGYPINSGHNNVRSPTGGLTERQLTAPEYAQISSLQGLAGVGGSRLDHVAWVAEAQAVMAALGDGGVIGFGTDSNGVSPLMGAPPPGAAPVVYSASYPMSTLGGATWDYNDAGVAHYGMISDFLQGVMLVDGGPQVVGNMMRGAQAFHDSWARVESFCAPPAVDAGPPPPAPHHHFSLLKAPECAPGTTWREACRQCLGLRESCPPCDAVDGGPCLPATPCPRGSERNAWGVCQRSGLQAPDVASLPMAMKLQRSGPGQVTVPQGKYVLRFPAASPPAAFAIDLVQKGELWSVRGKALTVKANTGFAGGIWVLEWLNDRALTMLVARPKAGQPVRGGFAVHRPGGRTATGEFVLEKATASSRKDAKPFEQLNGWLEAQR